MYNNNKKKSKQRLQTLTRTSFEWCILCGICVLVCYEMNKRHNWNCHFITAGSDDRVTRCPSFMHPRFDQTPNPDP